jgi:hypothetical protein
LAAFGPAVSSRGFPDGLAPEGGTCLASASSRTISPTSQTFPAIHRDSMRRKCFPEPVTHEDVQRLQEVLRRRGGSCTLRDLYRRHSFWDPAIFTTAEAAGIISIETIKPRTGRPSRVAVLKSAEDNISAPAKLPRRSELPRGITRKEERFLALYFYRWGSNFFGEGKNGGCATNAYAAAYGKRRPTTRASDRSSASRLLRRPWMRAGFLLDRRLMNFGGRIHWPDDLFSAAGEWLALLRSIEVLTPDWPPRLAAAIRISRTYPEALNRLRELAASRPATIPAQPGP